MTIVNPTAHIKTAMLFTPLSAPSLQLRYRIVMAPMTQSRAVGHNTPNALMAEYYGQRATVGLIVTEGTSPSLNGLGHARPQGLHRLLVAQRLRRRPMMKHLINQVVLGLARSTTLGSTPGFLAGRRTT